MNPDVKVGILLVDDQPSKLLSYEAILGELGENLIKASSGREALQLLLKNDIAVILMDVNMPELDGFQLAAMIREHPRFLETAIIFVSAINLSDVDHLRGYQMGAVDYVPIPVVPQVLRAKVKVFAELYRKTRQLENLNFELERRVAERTTELEASATRLLESERRRNLALAAGRMGSWDWDLVRADCRWDEGQHRIFGVDPSAFVVTLDEVRRLVHPEDWEKLENAAERMSTTAQVEQVEFRVCRPNGQVRWCIGTAAATLDAADRIIRVSGVTFDITDRKLAEERQALLAQEVDHRAKNALAVVQSVVRLTRAENVSDYVNAVERRIHALSRAHALLAESRWKGIDLKQLVQEEFAPYLTNNSGRVLASGPEISLRPATGQSFALFLHELATNAAKHGALSSLSGTVTLVWDLRDGRLVVQWREAGGPPTQRPASLGFGTKMIRASVERQLGGQAVFDWHLDGLRCTLSVPVGDQPEREESVAAVRPGSPKIRFRRSGGKRGKRVLVAEDETLVALMMNDMLGELGFTVIGPFSGVAETVAAARSSDVDVAVLDVNLRGQMIYPVAEILTDRGVPFIFITGYDFNSIDRRFSHAPILQKPVERQRLEQALLEIPHDAERQPESLAL